jgi:hypothetical protein
MIDDYAQARELMQKMEEQLPIPVRLDGAVNTDVAGKGPHRFPRPGVRNQTGLLFR